MEKTLKHLVFNEKGQCLMEVFIPAAAFLALLDEAGRREPVMASLLDAIQGHLSRRAGETCAVGAVLFSNEYGLLGETPEAKEIMERWN